MIYTVNPYLLKQTPTVRIAHTIKTDLGLPYSLPLFPMHIVHWLRMGQSCLDLGDAIRRNMQLR